MESSSKHRRIALNSSEFYVSDQPPADNYSDVTPMFAHLGALNIARDAVILDVGANIGIFSLSYARLCSEGTVYAFEPHPGTFEILVGNIALNRDLRDRVRPLNLGLSNAAGSADISIPTAKIHSRYDTACRRLNSGLFSMHGDGVEKVTCRFVDLDAFMPDVPRLDLMKIDVEGSEYEVLEGARRTIDRLRPVITLEYNDLTRTLSRHDSRSFETFFRTRGYRVFGLQYGWTRTQKPLDDLSAVSNVSDLVCVPDGRLG